MLIVMRDHASQAEIDHVVEHLHEAGAEAHLSQGEVKTVIGVIGDRELIYQLEMDGFPGVTEVIRVLKPYKLISREFQAEDTVVRVKGHPGTLPVTTNGGEESSAETEPAE